MPETILAIDTCCHHLSLALFCPATGEHHHIHEPASRELGEKLHPALTQLCEDAGIQPRDLTRIAVTIGPASFTSVRIGLTAARGLALALNIPIIGWNTLSVLYQQFLAAENKPAATPLTVLHAAHGNNIFVQQFPDGSAFSTTTDQLATLIKPDENMIGDAPFRQDIVLPDGVIWHTDPTSWAVDPVFLAKISADITEHDPQYGAKEALYVHPLAYDKVAS